LINSELSGSPRGRLPVCVVNAIEVRRQFFPGDGLALARRRVRRLKAVVQNAVERLLDLPFTLQQLEHA
jgi:hypothetical protein